ncbi:hypothetical protein ACFOHS_04135 [Jhaorihella thermophila]
MTTTAISSGVTCAPSVRSGGKGRDTKERLARKAFVLGHGDKADRVETVVVGKALGLVQRLSRHGGDMGEFAIGRHVKRQFVQRIGRGPVQRGGRRLAAFALADAPGPDRHVADLVIGDEQLAADPRRVQRLGPSPQIGEFPRQIRGIQRHRPDAPPPAPCAMQQSYSVKGKG